ncbi:lysoplasmalogenase-like [Oppia nitens]|uniref:lysoplasmalogenase-like n=1 Tax=Oppia nitens TaxID=1686743 RepID=UPI0023DC6ACD|nr:lysoplasmalogenase-like [Oppia nitens]
MKKTLRNSLIKLVTPFILLVVLCFQYTDAGDGYLSTALLKLLPILWLILCLKVNNINIINNSKHYYNYYYTKRIGWALVASLAGDLCLVWPENYWCLTSGILCFSVGHLYYIWALGFEPMGLQIFLSYFLPLIVANAIVLSFSLKGPLLILVLVYTLLIMTMLWRSLVLYQHNRLHRHRHQSNHLMASCVLTGALLFTLSDACLSLELFQAPDLLTPRNYRLIVLTTYYLAQLLFTVSTLLVSQSGNGGGGGSGSGGLVVSTYPNRVIPRLFNKNKNKKY